MFQAFSESDSQLPNEDVWDAFASYSRENPFICMTFSKCISITPYTDKSAVQLFTLEYRMSKCLFDQRAP